MSLLLPIIVVCAAAVFLAHFNLTSWFTFERKEDQ